MYQAKVYPKSRKRGTHSQLPVLEADSVRDEEAMANSLSMLRESWFGLRSLSSTFQGLIFPMTLILSSAIRK